MNDWIGKQLGQYEIVAEIGRGGMAVVYQAWQPALGRHVAIKVLPPHFTADQGFVARFQREAMAAAQLNHPNIVTIHDVGQEGNTHFIVMEYLEGQSLYDLLKTMGPMPLTRVTHIVSQVASALDYAHQRGFVHRDIKPANIIIGSDDRATLTDFGIAKAVEGTSLTQTGTMVGTPQYMAPEQVQGATVDCRADVYALGIVCYEMLAGVPPFTGDTAAVLYAQAHKPPPPLRQHLPRLPAYVENALNWALAKDPAERFATAGELATALRAEPTQLSLRRERPVERLSQTWDEALATQVTAPTTPPPQQRTPTPPPGGPVMPYPPRTPAPAGRRRSPGLRPWLLLGGSAAVLLIAVAALLVVLSGGGSDTTSRQEELTQISLATPIAGGAATQATSATSSPTASATPAPTVTPPSTPGPTATPTPTPSATPTLTPPSLRLAFVLGSPGDADIYLIDADGWNQRRLIGGQDDQAEPDWSPDEQRVAYQSDHAGNYDIWVIDADGRNERQLTTTSVDEREPDWSPDGRQIVYRRGGEPNGDGELWVMDADGRNQRRLGGGAVMGRAPVWSPAGQQVAFMSERSGTWDIYLFDLGSGGARRLTNCSTHCRFPNWSPDGQYVVYHSTKSASSFTPVQIWRQRADGSESPRQLVRGNDPGRAAWSSEGLIAFNTDDAIEIMNADGTDRHELRDSEDGWAPDWSR